MIDLDKIRRLPHSVKSLSEKKEGSKKYNHTEIFRFFRFIYNTQPLSDKLSYYIWNSIKDIWVDRGYPRWRPEGDGFIEGVWDPIGNGKYERSKGINWTNTNYTIHTFIWIEFIIPRYPLLKIPNINDNDLWDYKECEDFINMFGSLIWENRYELFDDGEWKEYQKEIRSGIDERGSECQKIIELKYKSIWLGSTNYLDIDVHVGGGPDDYKKGIDGYVYFNEETKTCQIKSSGRVTLINGEYWVPVSLKTKMYKDVDYLCFVFGSNENTNILVIDNQNTTHREEYINGNPFHIFNIESKYYSTF